MVDNYTGASAGIQTDEPEVEPMARGYEAISTVTIQAPPSAAWSALVEPDLVTEYMHGTHLETDWKVGSPIRWSGEWKGRSYEDKGAVLEIEPERRLKYTHWSPMGGSEDLPENYHTVTLDLVAVGDGTELTLTQDNNPTQADADTMAKSNWAPMLEGLKATAEHLPR